MELFFHINFFFLQIMYILLKTQIFFQKKPFFLNLVLQRMNNHIQSEENAEFIKVLSYPLSSIPLSVSYFDGSIL